MTLELEVFTVQVKDFPGFAPNGTVVSNDGTQHVIHVMYSKQQARSLLAEHDIEPDVVTKIDKMIGRSVLPEVSQKAMIRLEGFVTNDLVEALEEKDPVPDDFETPPGIFYLVGPRKVCAENPYVLCAVNREDGNVSIYAIPSLLHFDSVVFNHRNVISAEAAKFQRSVLEQLGLPMVSTLELVHIDGYAAGFYGAGLNISHYKDLMRHATSLPRKAAVEKNIPGVKRMLYIGLPQETKGVSVAGRLNGMLFVQDESGHAMSVFYSKCQAITLVADSKDMTSKDRALELIKASCLPDTSLKSAYTIEGPSMKTLHDAFACHLETEMSAEERAYHASDKVELIDPYFPAVGKGSPEAILCVKLSALEQIIYVCKSKRQMLDLFKKHAKLIRKGRLAPLKKSVEASRLPQETEEPMITVEGTVVIQLYRGLRLLWLHHQSN